MHFKRREEENLIIRILWAPPKLKLEAINYKEKSRARGNSEQTRRR